jgi:CRP-like cAMP-binding protein
MPTTPTQKPSHHLRIGEILIQSEMLHPDRLPGALSEAQNRGMLIGEQLVLMQCLSMEDLESALQFQSLINSGELEPETAIQALRIMRRDGIALTRALSTVQSDIPDKEEKLERIREIIEKLAQTEKDLGSEGRELVPICMQLGDLYTEVRDYSEAEKSYKRAVKLLERAHNNKHIKLVPALEKLHELYMLVRRYSDAEPLCWRLVEINQADLGAEHLDVARSLFRLARTIDARGKLLEAEQFYLSSLRIFEKQLGFDNPELKSSLRHLSFFWRRKGRTAEHKRIGELLVDAELMTSNELSSALDQSNKDAMPVGQTLLRNNVITPDVLKAALQAQLLVQDGAVPAQVATRALRLISNIGITLDDALRELQWEPDEVTTQQLQSLIETSDELAAAERALGANHMGVASIALRLGDQYCAARKFASAESSFKRALGILKQSSGDKNAALGDCLFKLAHLYYIQKRLAESEPMHWRALEIRKACLGEDHLDIAQSLEHIAILQEALGNQQQADMLMHAARSIREKRGIRRRELVEFLIEKTLFKTMEMAVLNTIADKFTEVSYAPGQIILTESQQTDSIYIVRTGTVEVIRESNVVAYLTAGDCFGDIGILDEYKRHALVRVPEGATVLRFDGGLFEVLKKKYPALEEAVLMVRERRSKGSASTGQSAGLQGNLAFFDLSNVLQILASSQKTGILLLSDHNKREVAKVGVRNGNLVHAQFCHLHGLPALYELLTRNDPLDFTFEAIEWTEAEDALLSSRPMTMLLMEAARRSDELPALVESVGWPRVRLAKKSGGPDTCTLGPDEGTLATHILRLLANEFENDEIERLVHSDRYSILQALSELLKAGLIERDSKATLKRLSQSMQ